MEDALPMFVRTLPFALALALCAGAPPLGAEEPTPSAETSAPLLHGTLELSLTDAVKMSLENNLGVQVERFGPLIAQTDAEGAWGAYDPTAFGELGYFDQERQSTISFDDPEITTRARDALAGLRGLVPFLNTEYEGRWDGERSKSNTLFQAFPTQYNSGWSVSVTQPLARDLIWNDAWTQVRTSKVAHESSEYQFARSVMDLVRNTEDAYWQLIADQEEVRVSEKSLETARALLDQTKTQFEVGVVSRVEVTEAEAGLEAREFNRIVSRNRYRNQQDVLIDLVLGPGLRAASTLEIEPTDRPEEYTEFEVDVEQAVERAFEHRPELAAAQKDVERQEFQSKLAWNQRLPEVDAILAYGQSGVVGNEFENTSDFYSDNPEFTARARLSIPIPNTSARNTYDRRKFELRRAETQLRQVEQQVILEVRQAARNLEASQEGIQSAERASDAAEEQLRAERIRHEYGESTPFDVLQREEQLVDREVERIEAYRAYRSSAVALDRAQGTILRNRNIQIEEVSSLR
jgi:outer membrane protein TolC